MMTGQVSYLTSNIKSAMDVEVHDLGDQIDGQGEAGRPNVERFHKQYKFFDWNSPECAENLASCKDEALV